jgi:hypothetical protein
MTDLWETCEQLDGHADATGLVHHPRETGRDKDIEHLLSLCLFFLKLNDEESDSGKLVKDYQELAEAAISSLCRDFIKDGSSLPPYHALLQKLVPRRNDWPRTKFFTTNYDLTLETSAEKLGMPFVDGFSFGFPRVFHGRWLDYDFVRRGKDNAGAEFLDGVFQLLKLHGSIDWEHDKTSNSVSRIPSTKSPHLVYPRDEKFALSYEQPFLEMISRYQTALREPDTCLVVVGFGFNDHHLVQPIRTALLSNPNSFKVVISDYEIEKKLALGSEGYSSWKELAACQEAGADITFVEGAFSNFTSILPSFSDARRSDDLLLRLVKAFEPARQSASSTGDFSNA